METAAEFIRQTDPAFYFACVIHRNTLGQRMDFASPGRQWLIPILTDKSPNKVIIKSVQSSGTEWLIAWAFSRLHAGLSGAYVLPTKVIRDKFVRNRIDALMLRVPQYKAAIIDTDNTAIKRFWNATVSFFGSNIAADFTEFPAQWYIIDELDRCDKDNLPMLDDRTSATRQLTGREPEWIKISNPTIGNYGISAEYNNSKKYSWQIECRNCQLLQPLDWFKNVVKQDGDHCFTLVDVDWLPDSGRDVACLCRNCGQPLDRLGPGKWIADNPSAPVAGYQISKLMTGQTTVRELWEKFLISLNNQSLLQIFYNSDLGIPFDAAGDKLHYSDLDKCVIDTEVNPSAGRNIAGIDVGGVCHVVVRQLGAGKLPLVYAGVATGPEDIIRILKRYNVSNWCMDAQPETHMARMLLKKHPGGYLCQYNSTVTLAGQKVNRENRVITTNRTESIDDMTQAFFDGYMQLPANYRSIDNGAYVAHLLAPTRVLDMSKNPPRYDWQEGNDPDHYFHGENYCYRMARMLGFQQRALGGVWA